MAGCAPWHKTPASSSSGSLGSVERLKRANEGDEDPKSIQRVLQHVKTTTTRKSVRRKFTQNRLITETSNNSTRSTEASTRALPRGTPLEKPRPVCPFSVKEANGHAAGSQSAPKSAITWVAKLNMGTPLRSA
ncbi:hypothetical protein RvY_03085 [Ramazzottius varieornatus]|uniref:Uncharacterized protein n=1 Tax=Ramazzottius varieornatus TaxID=947166 RepID=A0A1D1ULV4_RAMVA|nr:hypothetical protein RvY_03085 [Ramazzottius varieornatus]